MLQKAAGNPCFAAAGCESQIGVREPSTFRRAADSPCMQKRWQTRYRPAISALLSREVYYRQFVNRRQVGSFLGLTPSPYNIGEEERCQGISRAGRPTLGDQ
jgi:transposase IS116/IS110/IS902 family protein